MVHYLRTGIRLDITHNQLEYLEMYTSSLPKSFSFSMKYFLFFTWVEFKILLTQRAKHGQAQQSTDYYFSHSMCVCVSVRG